MAKLSEILNLLHSWLEPDRYKDYCPNGLQVEGCSEVEKIVTGVTAGEALIDKAVEYGADAILVHHGYFWKGDSQVIRGMAKKRLTKLLKNDISLIAFHLPLDVHPEVGNNAQLGKLLEFENCRAVAAGGVDGLLWYGKAPKLLTLEQLSRSLNDRLRREPLSISGGEKMIESVAWCTGAAQGFITQASELGVDAYISGEISEQTVHIARELGIHYFAAGHHATERYGIKALGERLSEESGIPVRFVDIPNPV